MSAQIFDHAQLQGLRGLHYDEVGFDCGHLAVLAQQRLFGREVAVPSVHPRGRRGQAALVERLAGELADPVANPISGDVGLYEAVDGASGLAYMHIGTVLDMARERWLLHIRVGGRSLIERERDARVKGLHHLGYYRLREIHIVG